MPLIHGKSKKAFEHNVKAEMEAHPGPEHRAQNLAIAYSVKRKAQKKKMAEGGEISAHDEKRPMPNDAYHDSKEVHHNEQKKPLMHTNWTNAPEDKMAQKPKIQPLSQPKMVQSSVIKAKRQGQSDEIPSSHINSKLADIERHLQEMAKPESESHPQDWTKEEDAKKMGKSPDMAPEHSTHKKPYAKGGMIESSDEHPHENKYMDDIEDLTPSHDEGDMYAEEHDEEGQNRQGPAVPDMEHPHNKYQRKLYAQGGEVDIHHDMMEQPEDEEQEEHQNSIAAAVMARMKRKQESMSGDPGYPVKMAEGGEVDLSRNADEDPNIEDDLSFEALKKENYSESEGLDELDRPEDEQMHNDPREDHESDKHDMVESIRRKMKHRQF